jgi:multisubunit Na+/H+ antiporter MnhB subunit
VPPAAVSASDEPGGRAGARRAPPAGRPRWHQVPYAIVLCCLGLALVWMRQSGQDVKGGTLAVAGVLFAAALARLALPERRAGLLASRRRITDAAILAALGTGLLIAGLLLPAQP